MLRHHGAGGTHVLEVLPALVTQDLAGEPDLAQDLQARTDEIGLADRGDVLGLQMRTALQAHDEQAAQRGVMGRQDDVGGGVHGSGGLLGACRAGSRHPDPRPGRFVEPTSIM